MSLKNVKLVGKAGFIVAAVIAVSMNGCFDKCSEGAGAISGAAKPSTAEQLKEAGMDQVRAEWALLRPATGLVATDYEGFQGVGGEPVAVQANGTYVANVYGVRPALIFATPRDNSATLAALPPETGIYMTTYAGNGFRMTLLQDGAGKYVYAAANSGYIVLDATTTVITALLSHPALDTRDASVRVQQLQWMCGRLASGWPEVTAAAAAYDAALSGRRDPVMDPGFATYIGQAFATVAAQMPDFQPVEAPPPAGRQTRILSWKKVEPQLAGFAAPWLFWGSSGDEKKVAMTVASAGKNVTYVETEPLDEKKGNVTAKTWRGTAIDYYYTAKLIDKSKLPLDSTALTRPQILDRLPLKGKIVSSGIIGAKSLWSYLDVVGSIADWATTTAGESLGILSVSGQFEAKAGDTLEVRFFSGGSSFGNDPAVYQHVQQYYAAEAHKAFAHNVAMMVTESLLLIPGADVVFGEDLGGKVITAAVTQALKDLQGNAATGSLELSANTLISVCSNAAKTALNTAITELQGSVKNQARKAAYKKLLSFFAKGGRRIFSFVRKYALGGALSKGGCIGNRAVRMIRPNSIMEYHVVEVGGGACKELMKKMLEDPDHGITTPIFCEECLSHSCEPQCQEVLAAKDKPEQPTAMGSCSDQCTAESRKCEAELEQKTRACNQSCGTAGRAECMKLKGSAMSSCLTKMPFECMKKCRTNDAMTGKPCLDKLVACQKRCAGSTAAATSAEPLEALYECMQANCKSRCVSKYDRE